MALMSFHDLAPEQRFLNKPAMNYQTPLRRGSTAATVNADDLAARREERRREAERRAREIAWKPTQAEWDEIRARLTPEARERIQAGARLLLEQADRIEAEGRLH